MQEIIASIKFTTPCLGSIRGVDIDRMYRDDDGRVIFLQTWWRKPLEYAAKAKGIDTRVIQDIRFDPTVDGTLVEYKRFFGPKDDDFKLHEAFNKDQIISFNAMLPDGVSLDQFIDMLKVGGRYVGISPYGHDKGFGRFSVVSVKLRNN